MTAVPEQVVHRRRPPRKDCRYIFLRMVQPMSSFERKGLAEIYLTELSLLAKRLCPEARIEATTEAFENEDGHVRAYPPAGLKEEVADIEGKLADRCVEILVEKGVLICSPVYD